MRSDIVLMGEISIVKNREISKKKTLKTKPKQPKNSFIISLGVCWIYLLKSLHPLVCGVFMSSLFHPKGQQEIYKLCYILPWTATVTLPFLVQRPPLPSFSAFRGSHHLLPFEGRIIYAGPTLTSSGHCGSGHAPGVWTI